MKKLEDDFIKNGGCFKEYKIGELFEKVKHKDIKYKKQDLPKIPDEEYCLSAVTCTTINQGVECYLPKSIEGGGKCI